MKKYIFVWVHRDLYVLQGGAIMLEGGYIMKYIFCIGTLWKSLGMGYLLGHSIKIFIFFMFIFILVGNKYIWKWGGDYLLGHDI